MGLPFDWLLSVIRAGYDRLHIQGVNFIWISMAAVEILVGKKIRNGFIIFVLKLFFEI